jgi:hypothetical protein
VPKGFMGATASVFSDAAPSFAATVGDKPSAPFATVGVPELEVAAATFKSAPVGIIGRDRQQSQNTRFLGRNNIEPLGDLFFRLHGPPRASLFAPPNDALHPY